jgi:hypothetical protein
MKSKEFWNSVWADVLANTVSGILIAFLALITIDRFYQTPQLGGVWEFTTHVEDSSYSSYQGLAVTYQVVLLQKELQFSGGGDKFSEMQKEASDPVEYSGSAKIPLTLTGYIEKNFFSENKVFVSINENGSIRDSSAFHELRINEDGSMSGIFFSTSANSSGKVTWKKII